MHNMSFDLRKKIPPVHKPPRLDKDTLTISFENQWAIKQAYKEIIGLNNVDHISINIVSPNGEMSVISYNPSIIYDIFKDGTYLYNGSISPTYYENLDFYTWDQCFDKRFYSEVEFSLKIKHGIDTGVVLVHRALGFNILFSFASKCKHGDLFSNIVENSSNFLKMGFHCLDLIKNIYSLSHESDEILHIKQPDNIQSICRLPNLTLIK